MGSYAAVYEFLITRNENSPEVVFTTIRAFGTLDGTRAAARFMDETKFPMEFITKGNWSANFIDICTFSSHEEYVKRE